MTPDRLAVAILFGVLIVGYGALLWASRRKNRERLAFLRRMDGLFADLGAEPLGGGAYRAGGRVYTVDADATPMLRRRVSIRLAMCAPGAVEFELKRADHVPRSIADHPFYRNYAVVGADGAEEYLRAPDVAETLAATLPGRWGAFSHHYVERVLYANLFDHADYGADDLRRDLAALARLGGEVPRRDLPERVTLRHGFEPDVPRWHWTPEDLARHVPGLTRVCVSAWAGSPLLNATLLRLFDALAGGAPISFMPTRPTPDELLWAYDDPDPVAADHFMDGAFFGGLVAGAPAPDVPLYARHRAALDALGDALFYARRLRDDEDSWFAGEYEILSRRLTAAKIEEAVRALGLPVVVIDRPFSPKLFREDRLDVGV